MTTRDINTEILATYRGRIMRKLDASAFKFVVCLGPTREGDKLRVCVWSDNGRCWSNVQTRRIDQLGEIDPNKITRAQNRAVAHAMDTITANRGSGNESGIVKHGGGAVYVGQPWFNKAATAKPIAAGVTKLVPVNYSAANKRQVRELNKVLRDAGRK